MEQSTSGKAHTTHSSLSTLFTDDEIEIAGILLQLPNLVAESESAYRFSVKWVNKRRRSAIDLRPSPSPLQSLQVERETERRPKVKAEASSPATPLSFSPSESDGKSKHKCKKVSKKRVREEWMGIIDGLIQSRELLRGEIENVKSYYNKLKAFNLELKAKKQEVLFYLGNSHLEMSKSLNYGMIKLNQPTIQSAMIQNQDLPQIHCMVHQQTSISDQTAHISSHTSENFHQYPYDQKPIFLSSEAKHVAPLGIPDLNVSAEETFGMDTPQPLDHFRALTGNRSRAAEARRKRMVRVKEMKNSLAPIKPPRC